jgi:hypothetical protein
MIVMESLQSLVFLAVLIAVVFFCARVITDAERRHMAGAAAEREVSLVYLMAEPEPAAAPRAHLRLVHSGPGRLNDEPYDQMNDRAI